LSFYIEFIGLFAGFLGVIAWIPQIKDVWHDGSHEGISLPTFWLVASALLLWLIYGILMSSYAIIISNISALICILLVIIGVTRLRSK
tara:strand:- start:66 stop:329 length:264 start_codon:yes stop_codon:yes gene_type:complete